MAEIHRSRFARTRSNAMGGKGLRTFMLLLAYPALRQVPRLEWGEALAQARGMSFDKMECIGIVAGVAFVTYLLRFDANQAATLSLLVRYCMQFVAAVPLLALAVGPLCLRRTRRGLDQEIKRRHSPGPFDPQG